jgi:hypothetical protein
MDSSETAVSSENTYSVAYRAAYEAAQAKITEAMEEAKEEWFSRLEDSSYDRPSEAGRDATEDIYKTICDKYGIGGDVWSEVREAAGKAGRRAARAMTVEG